MGLPSARTGKEIKYPCHLFCIMVHRNLPAIHPLCVMMLFHLLPLFLAANHHLTTKQAFHQMCVCVCVPSDTTAVHPALQLIYVHVSQCVCVCECVSQLVSRGEKT